MTDVIPASTGLAAVLVHGAFPDASGWSGVIELLVAANVPAGAVVNPLRA